MPWQSRVNVMSLIFLPYSVIIKAAGVRLPARLSGCLSSGALAGVATLFYALTLLSRTIFAAAAGSLAVASISFAMFSKN